MNRSYSELIKLPTFKERFEYLKLEKQERVNSLRKFRYLNQRFYHSDLWKNVQKRVILRDQARDLGCEGYEILGKIYVHHMNPITLYDLENNSKSLFDMENLISCSYYTHEGITNANEYILVDNLIERKTGDTKFW